MHILRRTLMGASAVGLAGVLASATVIALATPPAGAVAPTLPQTAVAQGAAQWLGSQLTPQGTIDDVTPGTPDLSATAQAALSLGASGVDLTGARAALAYLKANSATYIAVKGNDGPGQLANLILAAHVLGANPTNFGGTNLVARLLATEQTSGANAGRFGTDAQDADFNAGNYDQGLALAALAAAGVKADAASISWLQNQQCANGGWTLPDNVSTPCDPDPIGATFPNEDTNTTSLAIQGLAAQGALTAPVSTNALAFLTSAQDADGGWAYSPNTADNPETSDPDSTALVIQALPALGQSPTSPTFDQGANTPLTALLSFQVTSGSDTGAFSFPGIGTATTGNVLATNQVVPTLEGLTLPYPPSSVGGKSYWVFTASGAVYPFGNAVSHGSAAAVALHAPIVGSAATSDGGGYWLAASDGGVFNYGDAGFFGSRGGQPLNKPIVGMAATPDGGGYWLVASDGGVFSYGDAEILRLPRWPAPEQAHRRHGDHARRRGLLAGGLRRRRVQLRRRRILRLPRRSAPEPAHRRHGFGSERRRLLAGGIGRRDLQLRRFRLLRLNRQHRLEPAHRGHVVGTRWRRLLAGGIGRRDLQLR